MPYWKMKLRFTQLENYQKKVNDEMKKAESGKS